MVELTRDEAIIVAISHKKLESEHHDDTLKL